MVRVMVSACRRSEVVQSEIWSEGRKPRVYLSPAQKVRIFPRSCYLFIMCVENASGMCIYAYLEILEESGGLTVLDSLADTSNMSTRQSLARSLSRPNYSSSLITHQLRVRASKPNVNSALRRFKTTATSTRSNVASKEEKENLSWAEYLSIRGKKRRWELVS